VQEKPIIPQPPAGSGALVIRPEMGALILEQIADQFGIFGKEVLPVINQP
jgi:hypothetical protein